MTSWDQKKKDDRGPEVQNIISTLKKLSSGRRERALRNLTLYELRNLSGFSAQAWENAGGKETDPALDIDRLCLVHSAIETAKSTLYAPQKPKPQFQTLGATWSARRVAYRADRLCEGILNQRQGQFTNVWSVMWDVATDAMVTGMGVLKVPVDRANKRIDNRIVSMIHCFVDPVEGRDPQNFFEIEPISRDDAKRIYGNSVELGNATPFEFQPGYDRKREGDIIELQHAWRLPYAKDKPGMWCDLIGGKVVAEGPWTCSQFPFVFLRWIPSRVSFWGISLADEGARLAAECSDYDYRLWIRAKAAAGKRIYYYAGSVKEDALTSNEAVQPVPVDPSAGALPTETMTPPFTDSEFNYRNSKVQGFWDAIGISQVSAAARREQGLSSGLALMTLNDTKAGRQLTKGQAFENAFVDLAQQYVWRVQELLEEDANYAVSFPGKRLLQKIDAAALKDLEDDTYSVSVAPASSLPHDPAGRQQMVQELYRSAIISADTAKQLIGWPDLESELDTSQAEREYVDELIDRYLQADEEEWDQVRDFQSPEAFIIDMTGAIARFAAAWFRARIDQATLPSPEEKQKAEFNIRLISTWMQQADTIVKERLAAAAPPAGTQAPPAPAPPPALQSPVG